MFLENYFLVEQIAFLHFIPDEPPAKAVLWLAAASHLPTRQITKCPPVTLFIDLSAKMPVTVRQTEAKKHSFKISNLTNSK